MPKALAKIVPVAEATMATHPGKVWFWIALFSRLLTSSHDPPVAARGSAAATSAYDARKGNRSAKLPVMRA